MDMRAHLRTLALAALCLLLMPLAAQAAQSARHGQGPTLFTVADKTPLRAERSGEAAVLKELPRALPVRLVKSEGAWCLVVEPGGRQGWVYQGHLDILAPQAAALPVDLFAPPPASMVLAEAADTSRSSRSMQPARSPETQALLNVLELPLGRQDLEEFLRAGGIGEYSRMSPVTRGGPARLPMPRAVAAYGGDAERTLGFNLAVAALRRAGKPAFGSRLQRYVNLVGLGVARYAPGNQLGYRFVVLDNPAPLSLSLPGGFVLLSTGLLQALDNEAQLAGVLAHEAAQASLGQDWARAGQTAFFRSGGSMTEAGMRSPLFAPMLDELLDAALRTGLDPRQEYEADAAAVLMAYRAGYDPLQLAAAIRNVERARAEYAAKQGTVNASNGQHPAAAERIKRIQALLARLPVQDGLALGTERFQASR